MARIKRKKNKELVISVKCDYCNQETETFVVNAEHLKFCIIATPGKEPEKDCLTDYVRNKNVQKEIKKERLFS